MHSAPVCDLGRCRRLMVTTIYSNGCVEALVGCPVRHVGAKQLLNFDSCCCQADSVKALKRRASAESSFKKFSCVQNLTSEWIICQQKAVLVLTEGMCMRHRHHNCPLCLIWHLMVLFSLLPVSLFVLQFSLCCCMQCLVYYVI